MRTASQTAKLAKMKFRARAPKCTASSNRPALCRSSACGGRFLVRFSPCFCPKVPTARHQSSILVMAQNLTPQPPALPLQCLVLMPHLQSKVPTQLWVLFRVAVVSSQDHIWEKYFPILLSPILSYSSHIHSEFGILGKKP